ncbi:MAG: penicillin-binding protein [Candidatus Moranbacteria bacterium CG10_big_fil_rev_8_21_14_0_10_35_21]|nr:MAG: penicillin-binding protein [Candidatus Moranbacteria bacterium CG10_big_fil_rev_8_21_14_0_10_35_21]PJA88990.1 MAG: penicillin-binding protein [Candidatus Moranbacteria bacterium CG_4_9_14_3_um_filter_36_9]
MIPRVFSTNNFKKFLKSPKKKLFIKIFLYLAGAGLLIISGVFIYFAKDLPSPEKVSNRFVVESTKIYDRTGDHILYEIHGEEKRTVIPFSEMPDSIKYATISLEDQDFYSHQGIKLTSILRAVFQDILNRGASQGGSTITQQFVKNSILTREKTFTRKIKEVVLSLEMEQKFSKDEILEMYLNEIPYGSNSYGIEAASQTFFSHPAKELTLEEATLLASLPQAPTRYSPLGSNTEKLKLRQEYALNQMAKLGYITQEQADTAKGVDVLAKINPRPEKISAPHFVMYIKDYLVSKYGEQTIEQGGLRVYTTLDWDKQQTAEEAIKIGAEKNVKNYRASNAALVAMDPKTGQILAMVGSKDYFDKTIDGQVNVATRERQPGSSFKPYVYLTAFEKGYTPNTIIWDVDTNFETDTGKDYNPKNYDEKNRGPLKIKEALGMSLNVPAVKVLYLAGIKNAIERAKSFGITTLNHPENYGLSLVLGGGEVTLLDHVNSFGTLATGGIKHSKTGILKIQDSEGEILEEYKSEGEERVIEEKYVAMLDHILSTNDFRAPVFGSNSPLNFPNRPVAAKTGTTNEWRDGWTLGYTPSLVAGVWAGNNDNSPMAGGADGVFVAAPIWRAFMDKALKNSNIESFPKYEEEKTEKEFLDGTLKYTDEMKVCEIPGEKNKYCLASSACPDDKVKKKKFFTGHSILWYVNKDDPMGDSPKSAEDDPQFKNWEKGVQEWAKGKKDYDKGSAPKDSCKADDFKDYLPSLSISSPSPGQFITTSPLAIRASISAGYGIKDVSLQINGSTITTQPSSSFAYDYPIPDSQKNTSLEIKITVTDKNGTSSSESKTVSIDIPIP